MHPILIDARRLGLYLLGWIPVVTLLTLGLGRGAPPWAAIAVFVPLGFVYAFIGLSAWWVCRVAPIERGIGLRAAAAQAVAAGMASAIWILAADMWVSLLDSTMPQLAAGAMFASRRLPLLVIGALLFWLASALHYLLIAFAASQAAERRALELSLLARDAELRALRAQIDPHFLFNSLNSISALTVADPPAARRMCLLLADFLRDTLRLGASARISLADEMRLADRFLEIERVRLGGRLQVTRETDPLAAGCLVPPLLLQPLVENAVVHGIDQLVDGGTIRIAARRAGSALRITLENPCDPDRPRRTGSGLGLDLLKQRVVTQFGTDGGVDVDERPDRFRVEVTIPCAS
ncbi:MAG TPA: histidine kinase [Vicinamibacterales bacterium]|nr:histidine kinase [Vicinamibacterales bacterium]